MHRPTRTPRLHVAHAHSDTPADPLFTYPTWEMALREAAALGKDDRLILLLDEFPYAAQSESALPSLLQNAWDHAFKPLPFRALA